MLIPAPAPRRAASSAPRKSSRAKMEASYEVLGDAQSEPASDEETDDVNGEEVRTEVEGLARSYIARTAISALGLIRRTNIFKLRIYFCSHKLTNILNTRAFNCLGQSPIITS
jgi:hypothetical protein